MVGPEDNSLILCFVFVYVVILIYLCTHEDVDDARPRGDAFWNSASDVDIDVDV